MWEGLREDEVEEVRGGGWMKWRGWERWRRE